MYFEKPGPENTDKTLEIAVSAAKDRKISCLVVASTAGATAEKALEMISGTKIKLVVVTHNVGFSKEGEVEFDARIKEKIENAGHAVLTGTMATRNLNKAISEKSGGYSQTEIVNATLRMFGQGIKVCAEMAAMACDSGLIPFDDVICVAGTGRGADTAAILGANSSNRFFNIKIKEILCKPAEF